MAVGSGCLLPPLSSGGAQGPEPWLRFHTQLIEPDRQISRIRLSDKTSRVHPRRAAAKLSQAYETEVPIQVREWIAPATTSPELMLGTQPPTQPRWSYRRVGLSPTGKAPPFHGARQERPPEKNRQLSHLQSPASKPFALTPISSRSERTASHWSRRSISY